MNEQTIVHCTFEDCQNKPHRRQLCRRHYDQLKNKDLFCSVFECMSSQIFRRGMCREHYRAMVKLKGFPNDFFLSESIVSCQTLLPNNNSQDPIVIDLTTDNDVPPSEFFCCFPGCNSNVYSIKHSYCERHFYIFDNAFAHAQISPMSTSSTLTDTPDDAL